MPADWRQIDLVVAKGIRAAGFTGVSVIFPNPLEADLSDVRHIKEALDNAGVGVAQANGRYGWPFDTFCTIANLFLTLS